MSSANRFAGDQGRKARWRNSARLNIMLLQGPCPQSALLHARETRFCVSYPWRAGGVGPCKGGVLGPPLAAGRRDHHVPLGASQCRFLPVGIALLAAPPPRLPAVQQDACKGCSETRSKVTRSWMAETRPDAFRALRERVSDGCSRCLSRERLGRPFRVRAGVLLPCGERCDLPGKGAVRSQLIPHTMTAFERQYVIAFCHRF